MKKIRQLFTFVSHDLKVPPAFTSVAIVGAQLQNCWITQWKNMSFWMLFSRLNFMVLT